MDDQQKQTVYEIICQHPEGVLARRVANQMGITKTEVNSYLYSYEGLELFEQNPDDYTWHLKEKLPASALLRVAVTHGDMEEVFIIVSDARDQETDSGIYWMGRALAVRILTAVHMNRDVFLYNNEEYLNPEDFDSPASMLMWAWENQQLHRVPEKQRPLESKKIVCPTRRTPWSVAVREVGKLNFEGMPYMGRQREGLNDIQFGLVKAFKETFPEPERNWGMLEKVLTNLAWRWVRANPDQCTRTPDLEVVNKVGFWMDEAMYVPHGDEIVYESDDIEE